MKYLYKYPQAAFPYDDLVATNRGRTRQDFEYELLDTGVFDERPLLRRARRVRQGLAGRPPDPDHGPQPRPGGGDAARAAHPLVPQHLVVGRGRDPPALLRPATGAAVVIAASHPELGERYLACDEPAPLLFTENETNNVSGCSGRPSRAPFVKDGIHEYLVVQAAGRRSIPPHQGTKASAHYPLTVEAGASLGPFACGFPTCARRPGGAIRPGLRRDDGRAPDGGGRVLRRRHPRHRSTPIRPT